MKHYTVALVGNPNVGKSTLFNKLTGKNQHTGNWEGKTVEVAKGTYKTKTACYHIVDLPGIYSLDFKSPEEKIAKDFLLSGKFDCVLILSDATLLHKNFLLTLQVLKACPNCVLCINMMDQAQRKGIIIDHKGLEKELNVPVIPLSVRKNINGIKAVLENIESLNTVSMKLPERQMLTKYITYSKKDADKTDRILDKIMCGKYTSVPVMLLFLSLVLWLTIVGANYPSALLSKLFSFLGNKLSDFLTLLYCPHWLYGIIIDGAYSVVAQVISVMLPPMMIFFPLFSILEESGMLPRIAFNLNEPFKKAGTSGKQALTMCMGLGCNAVGVVGCRIIPSKKQRLIAIITNSFMPCNGRFPTLILLISIILGNFTSSFLNTVLLSAFILLAILITFAVTKILSKSITGETIDITIELPSYKNPPFLKIIYEALINKTLNILLRAIKVSAPVGILLWSLNNLHIGSSTLLLQISAWLEPIGRFLAMDGVILLAFILGIPANEIVLPIAIMIYTSLSNITAVSSQEIQNVLLSEGHNLFTALSMSLFSVFHWPCATTLITIKKETHSLKYTLLSFFIPCGIGTAFCCVVRVIQLIFSSIF
ncbi:MAG: ferrous iron transporter B [Acutalibacteraceae bacterium]|nr:ferrous iron transporter B [Acutalibacteraceae bacterium]